MYKVFALGYGTHTIKAGAFVRENKEFFVTEVYSLFVVSTVLYKVKNLNFYAIRGKYLLLVERSNNHITVSASVLLTALTEKAKQKQSAQSQYGVYHAESDWKSIERKILRKSPWSKLPSLSLVRS